MSRYDIDLFDPAPDPDLVCCICKSVLDTPVESPCRHVFCRVCITTWLGTCPTCPTCRRSIVSTEPVMPLIQGIINRLKMKCVNHATGCTSTVTLEQYDAHVKDCAYQEVTCQFKNCGQVLLKGGLGQHETTCTFREVKCHKSCGLMITYVDRKKHDCVRALQQCVSDQQEALRQFREKENEWERMRQRLEKQVTKLSESIASSRRNSLTPWGMSLLSWLNLDSDHASGHDDNDYEEGSHDGNNDDYVLSEENVDNDGGYGTTNGVVNADSSDVMVLRSGSSVPVERGGGDGDVDAGWSRILPVPRLRSRSRFRSRDERQSRSETHDRSPLVSRDRSQSRSPTRPMWDTTSSRRRRFSRSRQARPLSRHLSRTRPDLTAIPGPDAHEESGNDRRSRRRARYYSRHDSDSDRSSASESNWSYRDEDLFLSDTYYSEHSSPYYTNGSYGARDYEDFPAEDTSHHESSSPVGIDTEEDTRTVVSISDSHISAEFSQQEDSDGEAERSLDNAPVNEHVSDDRISTGSLVAVDSRSAFDDSNGHADNAEDVGHIFDDITGGSSDGSRYVDDLNNIGHLGELLETYLQSGVHTSKGSAPDGYTADVALSADTYQDRERPAGEIHPDPTAGHPTCSSEDTRETHEEGRPDFKNLIRDSDIMVSAEETVGGEHHAGQNKASSSLVERIGATRKRRHHDDEGGDGVVSSRKKLKWHQPTDPWPSQDRWQADAVCDYYTHDYLNGTASSGSFRGFSRTDSRPSTVTNSAGPRAASDPQRRHKHPIRRHTSVGRISTLSSSSQPPTEARDRVTSQSGSANEGTTTGVHGRAASRTARPRHAASVSASARRDAADGAGSHRRYTVESTDVIATPRSGRRSSRRHRDLHTGRHDSRGGDQPTTRPVIARPPVDTLEGSDSNDTLWLPDNDGGDSSDHSQSTEPTSDSSYEVLVPKTWVQMLNEYDSEDSDRSWRP